ncbi:MAG TPA: MEDS domain-containing protein [Amycolatopsis sp.]|jgi:hypothetical protein|nr:MEDS domain-containing protein [Amycolatopsis sp.]
MVSTATSNEASPGPSGFEVTPGDHICAFYPTQADRDEILEPYLREGLSRGDKCFCVVDSTDPEALMTGLGRDAELAPILAARHLDVLESKDAYLRGGEFSTDRVMDFWEQNVTQALSDEFSFVRAVGEMTWAQKALSNMVELAVYESRLNDYVRRYPQVILCMYELGRFDGDTLVDILKVHPKVLIAGMLIDNPYYIAPEEFLADRASRVENKGT